MKEAKFATVTDKQHWLIEIYKSCRSKVAIEKFASDFLPAQLERIDRARIVMTNKCLLSLFRSVCLFACLFRTTKARQ